VGGERPRRPADPGADVDHAVAFRDVGELSHRQRRRAAQSMELVKPSEIVRI
jgi:hypothetical protein